MGNDVSSMAAQQKFKSTMNEINESLGNVAKEASGPTNKKEAKERRNQREEDYKQKQKERAERKSKLSEQWAASRQGAPPPPKK